MKMMQNIFVCLNVIVLLAVGLQIPAHGASNEQQSTPPPQKVLLEVQKNVKEGSITNEFKFTDPNFFSLVSGLVDSNGNFFVMDDKTCELLKFSPDGKLVKKAGGKGLGPGENIMPIKIKQNRDKIYVFDYQQTYVNIFDLDLNFLEQKKFSTLKTPLDEVFINENQFAVSSASLIIMYQHKFNIFNLDGNMTPEVKLNFELSQVLKQPDFSFKYLSLLGIDPDTGELWSAGISSYSFEHYGKDFQLLKIFEGNMEFKTTEIKAGEGQGVQMPMKMPIDLGKFFSISGGKIFYGYIFDKKLILDVISKDFKVVRYKLPNVRRLLYLMDEKRILVNLFEETKKADEIDETEFIGIIKLND